MVNGVKIIFIIIFIVDNSSTLHTDNTKKYILVLGKGPKNGLDKATIGAEAKYSANIKISSEIKFV